MLSPRGQLRMKQWEAGTTGQLPYTECRRFDVPGWESQWTEVVTPGTTAHTLHQALIADDPLYEILALPFTAVEKGGPCHHLFRRIGGVGNGGSEDVFRLQFSIQAEPWYDWPNGRPIPPDHRVVLWARQFHDRRYGDTPERARAARLEESDRLEEEAYAQADQPKCEFENDVNEMVAPYLLNGRSVPAHLSRNPPTPNKISARVPDGEWKTSKGGIAVPA